MAHGSAVFLVLGPVAVSIIFLPLFREALPLATLYTSFGFSLLSFAFAYHLIPLLGPVFVQRNLKGRDRLKPDGPEIPESMGLICASIYILSLILFIPFLFSDGLRRKERHDNAGHPVPPLAQSDFPHQQLAIYLAALLSLLSATLLGFLDDVFDIRWRYKLPIPLVASIPLLLVYFAEQGNTSVVLPRFVRTLVGRTILDLGVLYYVYMSMLSTFCTNSINILAGINGIEASQALVIAVSVAVNDMLYLPFPLGIDLGSVHIGGVYGAGMAWGSKQLVDRHLLSLYFLLPLIGVCSGFLCHNWYPAKAFPGDTLCYVAGMAFAVVGILGHFSKTLLLFFLPQIFNFVLSCPQLFGLVPCPRHRMPKLVDSKKHTKLISASTFDYDHPPTKLASFILTLLSKLRLVKLSRDVETGAIASGTNLTLLNTVLVIRGPMSERRLALECIVLQISGSLIAFTIRYGLAGVFYSSDDDRR